MALESLLHHDLTMKMLSVALITFVAMTVIPKVIRMLRSFWFYQSLPGIQGYSILYGNLHKLPKTGEDRFAMGRNMMDNVNNKFFRIWVGPFKAMLSTYHPETVKAILKSSFPKSRGFGQAYEFAVPWIGEGLISSNGARWARSRRLLTPAFHFDILKNYIGVYNKAMDTLFEKFDKLAETGESFDLYPPITLCTLEIILKCSMSYDVDIQRMGHSPYAQATRELAKAWEERARTIRWWPEFIYRLSSTGRKFFQNCDYVHKVAEDIIAKRKQLLEKEGPRSGRHLDFLDLLLTARDEDGNPMTTLEIRNEVDTFMFAGHDTTSTATQWILYCFAQHQDYQERVQEEIDAVLEGREEDYIQWSDLSKLPLLTLCIKEVMRLYPPVPFIQRKLNEDIELDGRKIPAGTPVGVAIVHLHRNRSVWEDPDKFWPERFSAENMEGKETFSFTPFSAGSRNCIGQNFALNEEKVIISRVLRRYKVEPAPDAPAPKRVLQAVLKSENGIWVRLKPRH